MKYCNSLKYIGSFDKAPESSALSPKRARELCDKLGRINLGVRYICLPKGSAGHASAVMLEAIMTQAGRSVGRVRLYENDPRAAVFVSGKIPSVVDFGAAVSELKSAVNRLPDESFYFEEVCFVLSLLICRMSGCEYIILEGICSDSTLESICAPYEIIVIPSVYSEEGVQGSVRTLSESIRRGTREVVSGNQKSEVYNVISKACANSGVRLCLPVKAQFEVKEVSSRSLSFNYCGREGFTMRSPSRLLRDVAMTVIECSLALRRGGVKLPWSSITSGISSVTDTGCFDMVSLSPLILMDTASDVGELELLVATAREVWGEDALKDAAIFTTESVQRVKYVFGNDADITLCGGEPEDGVRAVDTVKACGRALLEQNKRGGKSVCFGSFEFVEELKSELLKLM